MASWYVYEPPGTLAHTPAAADKAVFIKDAFSWGAFLVPFIWLLWRRMWLIFLAWFAVTVALAIAAATLDIPDAVIALLQLVFGWGFALEASALRAWTLGRKGWRLAGFACGADGTEAEYRYHEAVSGGSAAPGRPQPGAAPARAPAGRPTEAILGVFPEPYGGRS